MERCQDKMANDTEEKRKRYEKACAGPAERQQEAPFRYVKGGEEEIGGRGSGVPNPALGIAPV
jgi:hypothetical protein